MSLTGISVLLLNFLPKFSNGINEIAGFTGVTSVASFAEMSPVTCSVNYHYEVSGFCSIYFVHVLVLCELIHIENAIM